MATMFELQGSITLDPIWWQDPPLVAVYLNKKTQYHGHLTSTQTIPLICHLDEGHHSLSVEFLNKVDQDTDIVRQLDKAVTVKAIDFFGISDQRFAWAGEYRPVYNAHWVEEQQQKGITPAAVLKPHTYLTWNGIWTLNFSVPVFIWIHQMQSLGWIYD